MEAQVVKYSVYEAFDNPQVRNLYRSGGKQGLKQAQRSGDGSVPAFREWRASWRDE
jgi:hypothetical protein